MCELNIFFKQLQNLGRIFSTIKMHLSLASDLSCCSFKGGGSVVVDSMLIVAPIMWFCACSMFCCVLLCVFLVVLQSS